MNELTSVAAHASDPEREHLSAADKEPLVASLRAVLTRLGLPVSSATEATAQRWLDALIDATDGYDGDTRLMTTFQEPSLAAQAPHSQVVEGPIALSALCEHHALPMVGWAVVGYLPGDTLVGLSKLSRIVASRSRRFTVQERIGEEVGAFLSLACGAHGAAVYIAAQHSCVIGRGVKEATTTTNTLSWHGAYRETPSLRDEFLSLVALTNGHVVPPASLRAPHHGVIPSDAMQGSRDSGITARAEN